MPLPQQEQREQPQQEQPQQQTQGEQEVFSIHLKDF